MPRLHVLPSYANQRSSEIARLENVQLSLDSWMKMATVWDFSYHRSSKAAISK